MQFVKSFTRVRFPKLSILPEKRVNRENFCQKMKMWSVLLIHFKQIVSRFANSTQIQITQVILGKITPEFDKFHRKCNFSR